MQTRTILSAPPSADDDDVLSLTSEADEADVVIRLVEPGLVGILMRNAVHAQPTGKQSSIGYGSRMLDQITESWSVAFEDGDAILSATVALNQ